MFILLKLPNLTFSIGETNLLLNIPAPITVSRLLSIIIGHNFITVPLAFFTWLLLILKFTTVVLNDHLTSITKLLTPVISGGVTKNTKPELVKRLPL